MVEDEYHHGDTHPLGWPGQYVAPRTNPAATMVLFNHTNPTLHTATCPSTSITQHSSDPYTAAPAFIITMNGQQLLNAHPAPLQPIWTPILFGFHQHNH